MFRRFPVARRKGFVRHAVIALAASLALASPAFAGLEFDKLRHDFGDIGHYDKPEVTFTFTNTGDEPVEIKAVRASSRVGRPTAPDGPIAPGESGEILVKARTRYGGPFRVHLEVREVTAGPIETLIITGNVLSREESVAP